MKNTILLMLASALVLGLSACGQPASGQVVVQSDKPRITAPSVSSSDQAALADGNTDVAFRMYQALRQSGEGLFYSPYSISEAIAMTYAGARGETEKGMASALGFTLPQDRLHAAFNSLDLQLRQRGQGARGKDGKGFRLNVVNAIWGQRDYKFLGQFLDVLAQNYGAGLRVVDFIKETEPARTAINKWVSDQTEEKIRELIPPGAINSLTRLVLTNAIYFNAAWQQPFRESATSGGTFHLLNGSSVTVPMMKQTQSFAYAEGANYQAVELPYDGGQLAMTILLPGSGQFEAFELSLDRQVFKGTTGRLGKRQVALTMPKFRYESSLGLKKALTALGMGAAFTTDADFSGMDGKRDLFIHDVLHKAFVAVDEAGTEAAAATGVIVGVTSLPPQPIEVKIDRPFIFVIRDLPTGSVIFVGRVLNPAAK